MFFRGRPLRQKALEHASRHPDHASYAPMITPNYGPPLGIPVGVFEEDEGTVPRSLLLTAKPGSNVSLTVH